MLPRDPGRALQILENYLRMRLSDGQSMALIIDFAETLAPGGEMGSLSAEDRFALATLVKWASDPQFLAGDLSIVLLVENLAEISGRLARNPYVASIELPLPTEEERQDYVQAKLEGKRLASISEIPAPALAKMSAGPVAHQPGPHPHRGGGARRRASPRRSSRRRRRRSSRPSATGCSSSSSRAHTLDSVAGHARAKEMLRQAAAALRKGRLEVLPMGYLVSGPVGTGKTFLATCFAGEIGIPCVKFLNFRSQWQGVTEANLEKIFNLLKALWPVAVMIDEADAFLGNRGGLGRLGHLEPGVRLHRLVHGQHRVPGEDRLVPPHLPAGSPARSTSSGRAGRRSTWRSSIRRATPSGTSWRASWPRR